MEKNLTTRTSPLIWTWALILGVLPFVASASADDFAVRNCHIGICDNDGVTVMNGRYQGLTGYVQSLNPRTGTFTLFSPEEGYFPARTVEVRRGIFPPSCLYGLCIGQRTVVIRGPYQGMVGWIEGFRPGRRMVKEYDSRGKHYILFPANTRPY